MIKSRLNLKRKNKEFCNTACAGDTENFDSLLNLKYFIQAVKFRWPTQNLQRPRNFLS